MHVEPRCVENSIITEYGEDPHVGRVQQDQALCLFMHYTTRLDKQPICYQRHFKEAKSSKLAKDTVIHPLQFAMCGTAS